MSKTLQIFTNFKNYKFFTQLFPEYSLNFSSIEEIHNNKSEQDKKIILHISLDKSNLKLDSVPDNYLLITNVEINNQSKNKNTLLIKRPLTVLQIKNAVNKYLSNFEIFFEDISIIDKKMKNIALDKFVFLTEIENSILRYLIENKFSSKEYVKKYILNINKDIETNSIESHLTRIRKKFQKIQTNLVIQSKNDNLSIFNFQKKED